MPKIVSEACRPAIAHGNCFIWQLLLLSSDFFPSRLNLKNIYFFVFVCFRQLQQYIFIIAYLKSQSKGSIAWLCAHSIKLISIFIIVDLNKKDKYCVFFILSRRWEENFCQNWELKWALWKANSVLISSSLSSSGLLFVGGILLFMNAGEYSSFEVSILFFCCNLLFARNLKGCDGLHNTF